MNQEKVGKLIAKMRKQKDLTQRQLGEMVGVGFRAVSKWERGQTMPDISIINELSEVLGITSDELLKGELISKEDKLELSTTDIDSNLNKKSNKRKILLLLIPILLIVFIVVILIIKNNNQKVEEYTIKSLEPNEYLVEGAIKVEGSDLIIKLDKIEFQDYNFLKIVIKDYQYSVSLDEKFVLGVGTTNEYKNLEDNISIDEFFNNFVINYKDSDGMIKYFQGSYININFSFLDINNNIIKKNLKLSII